MLLDREIVLLLESQAYRQIMPGGWKSIKADLWQSGAVDLKPELSTISKIIYRFTRSHIIRTELNESTGALLERILRRNQSSKLNPRSVEEICQVHLAHHLWMRFDEPRVKALFQRVLYLLNSAKMRDLIKNHSSHSQDTKEQRLEEIIEDVQRLRDNTINYLRGGGLYHKWVEMTADEYYKNNHQQLTDQFLQGSKGGWLGLPAPYDPENH